jgi:hypothetical protein
MSQVQKNGIASEQEQRWKPVSPGALLMGCFEDLRKKRKRFAKTIVGGIKIISKVFGAMNSSPIEMLQSGRKMTMLINFVVSFCKVSKIYQFIDV